MGLPEQFYSSTSISNASKPDLILVQSQSNGEPNETLGHQFLFGAIPLTRLQLSHGADDYLTEVGIQVAHENGFTPLVVSPDAVPGIAELFPSSPRLHLRYRNLAVSGYDLIVMRQLSSSGTVHADITETIHGGGSLSREAIESFDESPYGSAAQAPALEYLLRRGTASAVAAIYRTLRRHRVEECATADTPSPETPIVTLIAKPAFGVDTRRQIEANSLPQQIFATYGFTGISAGPDTLARIVQRGASGIFRSRNLPWAALPDNALVSVACPRKGNLARLNTNIKSIEYLNGGTFAPDRLKAILTFDLFSPTTNDSVTASCTAEIPLDSSKDGAGVFALEDLSALLTNDFLSGNGTYEGKRCVALH